MAKVCVYCGKGVQFGRRISHAHNVSRRKFQPNLHRMRVNIGGRTRRVYVCTRCLRSDKVSKVVSS
ncbi:MAG: 50S ribosomal protein L28 [Candidatus Aminicenantes bacterium]|nr:50S ribosomal protein L28 [Candidatus Aminicenantes bacterium]MDH5715061.1 50S ribosomal protein L28 [Candidatus Aminicenantes bacterium]